MTQDDAQRAETYAAFARIEAEADLPDTADIDYAFAPGDSADWDGAEATLSEAGFDCARVDEGDGAPYLAARLPDQPCTAMAIWLGEARATQLAGAHGFTPDGWGFSA